MVNKVIQNEQDPHKFTIALWNIFAKKVPEINNIWINVPIALKFLGSGFLPLSKILEKFWGRTPPPSRGWGGKFFHLHLFSLFEARGLDILIFETPSQNLSHLTQTQGGAGVIFTLLIVFIKKKLAWLKFVFYVAHHVGGRSRS